MTKIIVGALAATLTVLALAVLGLAALRAPEQDFEGAAVEAPPAANAGAAGVHESLLYGRITTVRGRIYEGQLRFGGDEEAFWGHYFNGFMAQNPWIAHVPPERIKEKRTLEVFGLKIAQREQPIDLRRPFMARFGEIVRIEAQGRDLRVTLKSGSVVHLDRMAADDLADGVRVWDIHRGLVDLEEQHIRILELLPTARPGAIPGRLHGTVRTRHGDFTGFVQWDREACLGTDTLVGQTADGELRLRFDAIRSIARASHHSSRVTLVDGSEVTLFGSREVGHGNRGIAIDDPRYGRVRVAWDAFEHVDLRADGGGPAYEDFPPGQPLTGSVTTRSGRRFTGRLVYDLDENETTDTLDAPSQGVSYALPLGWVASITPPDHGQRGAPARVALHGGEVLDLESAGDLGDENAGMLIFVEGRESPDYVPWADVEHIELDRPKAMDPPRPGLQAQRSRASSSRRAAIG